MNKEELVRYLVQNLNDIVIDETARMLISDTAEGLIRRKKADEIHINKAIYELSVIIRMKFPNYFEIVAKDICRPAELVGHLDENSLEYLLSETERFFAVSDAVNRKELAKEDYEDYLNGWWKWCIGFCSEHQTAPGITKGPGRGSAAGSVVTYALGITDIDPVDYGLLFERFLNPERVSMPDIDTDISSPDLEYGARDVVIAYLTSKYGSQGICGIATPSTLAPKAAVRAIARVHGSKVYENSNKKSKDEEKYWAKRFLNIGDKLASMIPDDPGISFSQKGEDGIPLKDVITNNLDSQFASGEIDEFEYKNMVKILDMSVKAEGLNVHYGKHACGMIIVDNGDVAKYAPQMMDIKTGTLKIQMDAEAAEAKGFLKMDLLALKQLNKNTKTMRLVFKNRGIFLDAQKFPQEPEVFKKIFAAANTNEVFQMESKGMKQMLKDFGPTCMEDIVLLVACFRPGPMKYLDGIIKRKHGKEAEPTAVTRIASYNKDLAAIVAPTYQALVYQEQVMEAFKALAGYSMGGADLIRRAMAHKVIEVLEAEKPAFIYGDKCRGIDGCIKRGIKEQDALDLFEELIDFSKYAFNKSHAASYAVTAYQTAWLKYHFPAEFYVSVLSAVPNDKKKVKVPALIAEARKLGIEVNLPDINYSEHGFTGNTNMLRFGFSSIKGFGNSGESILQMRKNGEMPYRDVSDFLIRTDLGQSDVEKLINAGALDCFGIPRESIRFSLPDFYRYKEIIKKKRKDISLFDRMMADLDAGITLDREKYKIKSRKLPDKQSLGKRKDSALARIKEADSIMQTICFSTSMNGNKNADLEAEKELLGIYLSGHPLDTYGKAEDFNALQISDAPLGYNRLFGIIRDLRFAKRKSDGKEMAFFTLEDASGSIETCVFTQSYEANGKFLSEGAAVVVSGKIIIKEGSQNFSDEGESEDVIYQMIADKAERSIDPKSVQYKRLTIVIGKEMDVAEAVSSLRKFIEPSPGESSCSIRVFVEETGVIGDVAFFVKPQASRLCTTRYYVTA